MSYNKEIEYLTVNKFKQHSKGNSGCYGLNFLGPKSIIEYNNILWMFVHWEVGSNIANYVNTKGEFFSFNPYHQNSNITRMEINRN